MLQTMLDWHLAGVGELLFNQMLSISHELQCKQHHEKQKIFLERHQLSSPFYSLSLSISLSLIPDISHAAIIRSLVAAHSANCANAQAQNPYVLDGLALLCDAQWNAGLRKFDPSLRTWVNLAENGMDVALPSFGSFLEDEQCVFFNRKSTRGVYITTNCYADAYLSNQWQIDIICVPTMENVNSDAGFLIATGLPDNSYHYGWWMRPTPRLMTRNYANETTLVSSPVKVALSVRPSPTNSLYVQFFKNGELFLTQKNWFGKEYSKLGRILWWDGGGRGFNMKLYCFRIYNRALTDEEIRANYAIDKERFGIQ